jgi:hypothetical protein
MIDYEHRYRTEEEGERLAEESINHLLSTSEFVNKRQVMSQLLTRLNASLFFLHTGDLSVFLPLRIEDRVVVRREEGDEGGDTSFF